MSTFNRSSVWFGTLDPKKKKGVTQNMVLTLMRQSYLQIWFYPSLSVSKMASFESPFNSEKYFTFPLLASQPLTFSLVLRDSLLLCGHPQWKKAFLRSGLSSLDQYHMSHRTKLPANLQDSLQLYLPPLLAKNSQVNT
jgi:hypothetical protein